MRKAMTVCLAVLCTALVFAGMKEEKAMELKIMSDAFEHEGEIPVKYTCEGEDVSPALRWEGVPEGARSLVLIVDDPDAPDPKAPKMTWVHWVLVNLPADCGGLPEGVKEAALPGGTVVGVNDWKKAAYGGPCPPIGRHRYYHKLYALDVRLEGLRRPTKKDVVQAMEGHVLAEAVLMGTYIKEENR